MTMLYPTTKKCAICGSVSNHQDIMSTNCFGAPDLDLRPAEMQRSTMPYWIEYCPECGYVAGDLELEPPRELTPGKIKEIYKEKVCVFKNRLAGKFYKKYLLDRYYGDNEAAFSSALRAAWSCDDKAEIENAIIMRKLALAELEKTIVDEEDEDKKINLIVCKSDLLRRSGQFEKVLEEYSNFHSEADVLNKIIAFQLKLSEEKDVRCYTVEDACK